MDAAPNPASVAELIGDPARATILTSLLGGESLPATDLAHRCRLKPQTVSFHLAKLLAGGLLSVEESGRHRYYRLAGPGVARVLEALNAISPRPPVRSLGESREAKALRFARTCYDHLAGELGVGLTLALVEGGLLEESDPDYVLTVGGRERLGAFGIDVESAEKRRRAFARRCLDWSERRHHLAGSLGAALAARLFELGWIERTPGGRAVALTGAGRSGLLEEFGLPLVVEQA
jgi:DNA-binding transcriptional ArsR family regulator